MRLLLLPAVFLLLALLPRAAIASSHFPSPSAVGGVRLATISFFLMAFLVSTLLARWMCASLHRQVPSIPRLSALACLNVEIFVALLLAVLLLMMAPARPLLQPGAFEAWELRTAYDGERARERKPEADSMKDRREAMMRLRHELWEYALCNRGQFPGALNMLPNRQADCFFAGSPGMEFCYVAGRTRDDDESVLAFEPDVLGEPRLALKVNGRICEMSSGEIRQAIARQEVP